MTKADLINAIAEKAELSKKDGGKAVDAFIEAVKEALAKAAIPEPRKKLPSQHPILQSLKPVKL